MLTTNRDNTWNPVHVAVCDRCMTVHPQKEALKSKLSASLRLAGWVLLFDNGRHFCADCVATCGYVEPRREVAL